MKQRLYRLAKRYVRKVDGFSYNVERNGERWLLERLSGSDAAVVCDVGANVGVWTGLALAAFPEARVHAFELSSSTFETLSRAHAEHPRCVLANVGLSDAEGEVSYKDYGPDSGKNTLLTSADYHDRTTPARLLSGRVTTGDAYCAAHGIERVDVLKIDVEGAEHRVIEGFSGMLGRGAVRLVQFEYGYTHGDAHFLMRDFYALFERHGYRVGLLRQGGVRFVPWSYRLNDFESGPNYVAVRADDEATRALVSA